MATVVDQVRRAHDWTVACIARHGGDPGRITVSGHSAGAHLASFLFTRDQAPVHIHAALLLGGLYELEPLRSSFLQAEIGLTDAEVRAFTPMKHDHDPATRVTLIVGAEETEPFHSQAGAFARHLQSRGVNVSRSTLSARNHMSSVRDLANIDTEAGQQLLRLIRGTCET
jgi:arylformamidase